MMRDRAMADDNHNNNDLPIGLLFVMIFTVLIKGEVCARWCGSFKRNSNW